MTSFVIPPVTAAVGGSTIPMPVPGVPRTATTPRTGSSTLGMPIPTVGPPIKSDHTGEYAGFVNHSTHRMMYQNKLYPTALHLLEALKFAHQPALQEHIRTCKDVHDIYPLSASFQEHVRRDWGQVFLNVMEVLYLKFKQHPTVRGSRMSSMRTKMCIGATDAQGRARTNSEKRSFDSGNDDDGKAIIDS